MTEYKFPNPFLPSNSPHSSHQPPANTSLGPLLEALMQVKVTKERQYFLGQTINLDGQKFIECRFDQCVLTTETGDIFLENCVFGENNVAVFHGNTRKIVQLASMLNPQAVHPDLLAKVQQAGSIQTITIK